MFSDWESVMSLVFDFPIDRTEFKDVFIRFRNSVIFELVYITLHERQSFRHHHLVIRNESVFNGYFILFDRMDFVAPI